MANKEIGLEIAKFLASNGDEISNLFLVEGETEINEQITDTCKIDDSRVFYGNSHNALEVVDKLLPFDFLVTVYWPHLIKDKLLLEAGNNTVNFHPAMLPQNRGWYPHVFNIIDGSNPGVTLHQIDQGADTGNIWVQQEVGMAASDTAKDLHGRLMQAMISIFKENWNDINSGKIRPFVQNADEATYNSIRRSDALDQIDLSKNYSGREILNLLRARTFGEKGFAYFIDEEGNRFNIRIEITRVLSDGKDPK